MMMKSLSCLGIGLSLVFGCLFLALLAELYYVFRWRKRAKRDVADDNGSSARELFSFFCTGVTASLSSTAVNPQEIYSAMREEEDRRPDSSTKDLIVKPFGEDGLESELMRLHHLSGPPRILFTIKEETREDLESEDGRSRQARIRKGKGSRNKSLADFFLSVETPFGTTLPSPPQFTPTLTPLDYYTTKLALSNGFNPLFEASLDGESNPIGSSPPPKFKFLRDAEEKLLRKLAETRTVYDNCEVFTDERVKNLDEFSVRSALTPESEEDGSFITIVVEQDAENHHFQHSVSGSTQLPPLECTPPQNAETSR